jgi:hypothetical protein
MTPEFRQHMKTQLAFAIAERESSGARERSPRSRPILSKNPISSHAENAIPASQRALHLLLQSSDLVGTAQIGRAGTGRDMGAPENAHLVISHSSLVRGPLLSLSRGRLGRQGAGISRLTTDN